MSGAERVPLHRQLVEAAQMLAALLICGPVLFLAADWLRYGA